MTATSNSEELLFEAITPLDFTVRVPAAYWDFIITIKHPVMAGCENDVKKTWKTQNKLESVEAIPRSTYSIRSNARDVGFVLSLKGSMAMDFLSHLTQLMQ